jgi:hypothetical protein
MPRKRPFENVMQYYVYAWFLKHRCIYAGYGKNNRCRDVRHKLSTLIGVSRKTLCAKAHIVVKLCDSRATAIRFERIWIKLFQPKFNIAPGNGGYPGMHTAKGKENIRKSKLGIKLSPETCAKMSAKLLGNKRLLGYVPSPETRAKISAANKGRKPSLLARQKSRERCIARNKNAACIAKMLETRRRTCGNKSNQR